MLERELQDTSKPLSNDQLHQAIVQVRRAIADLRGERGVDERKIEWMIGLISAFETAQEMNQDQLETFRAEKQMELDKELTRPPYETRLLRRGERQQRISKIASLESLLWGLDAALRKFSIEFAINFNDIRNNPKPSPSPN